MMKKMIQEYMLEQTEMHLIQNVIHLLHSTSPSIPPSQLSLVHGSEFGTFPQTKCEPPFEQFQVFL